MRRKKFAKHTSTQSSAYCSHQEAKQYSVQGSQEPIQGTGSHHASWAVSLCQDYPLPRPGSICEALRRMHSRISSTSRVSAAWIPSRLACIILRKEITRWIVNPHVMTNR